MHKLSELKSQWVSMPAYVKAYLTGYFFIIFLTMIWIPGNDFDSLSSYIARIELEKFGDLHKTATLELQYTFPKFFDYLHGPFLDLGYFTTFPTFALFITTCGLLIYSLNRRERLVCAIFVIACPPLLVAIGSFKNDLPLASFALIAWFCIFMRPNSIFYPALSLLSLAALAGTKWHGFFVIAPLAIGFSFQLVTTHRPSIRALWVVALMLPAYWFASSANVYLDNIVRSGSLTPRPEWLLLLDRSVSPSHLPINIYKFVSSSIIDTFDIPLYFFEDFSGWKLWPYVQSVTASGKVFSYAYLINSHFSAFGISILVVLSCSFIVLLRPSESRSVKAAAAAVIVYTVLVLSFIDYSTWTNRYFLTAYVLGLIPTARVIGRLAVPKAVMSVVVAYAFAMSLQALLLNQERRLLPVNQQTQGGAEYYLKPIYPDLLNRDRLYFHVWTGYAEVYDAFVKEIQPSDGLVFLNTAEGGDVPFLYPFIKGRHPANTKIINTRNGDLWDPSLCSDFRYILVYKGKISDAHYEQIYSYGGPLDMTIYRRRDCS